MSGIRLSRTAVTNTHRFPEWNGYVFYPSGSFVMSLDSDSETRFYIAIEDVPAGEQTPKQNIANTATTNYWVEAFTSNTRQLSSSLQLLVDNLTTLFAIIQYADDIERVSKGYDALKALYAELERKIDVIDSEVYFGVARLHKMIDSEMRARISFDSDIRKVVDSELLQILDRDSDLWAALNAETKTRQDEANLLKEDFRDIDSELRLKRDFDSDVLAKVRNKDYYISDSDYAIIINTTYNTVYQKYDSDFRYIIANNYKKYNVVDSEYVEAVRQKIFDYIDKKTLFYQTTQSVENFTLFNMNVRVDGVNNLQSGNRLITDFNGVSFSQITNMIVSYTAVYTPNTGSRITLTGRLFVSVPQTAYTNCDITEMFIYQQPNIGTVPISNISIITTLNGVRMYADVNYTSTAGTKVTVVADQF